MLICSHADLISSRGENYDSTCMLADLFAVVKNSIIEIEVKRHPPEIATFSFFSKVKLLILTNNIFKNYFVVCILYIQK